MQTHHIDLVREGRLKEFSARWKINIRRLLIVGTVYHQILHTSNIYIYVGTQTFGGQWPVHLLNNFFILVEKSSFRSLANENVVFIGNII